MANIFKKSISAVSRGLTVLAILGAFSVGLVGTMLIFLSGSEVVVPEIVGRGYVESENVLSDLGLRIKRRAERYSEELPGTVLEQIPKAGETVKTGQMILVVVSKADPDGDEKPATIRKGADKDSDDSDKIEELILDRPKPTPSPKPVPEVVAEQDPLSGEGETQPQGTPTPASPVQSPESTRTPVQNQTPRVQK